MPKMKYVEFLSDTHTRTHTRTHLRTHVHTHTHTHTQSCTQQLMYILNKRRHICVNIYKTHLVQSIMHFVNESHIIPSFNNKKLN